MKLSKLPKLLTKAEHCTSREEAQKIIKKAQNLLDGFIGWVGSFLGTPQMVAA
jgi:hypothetical protein